MMKEDTELATTTTTTATTTASTTATTSDNDNDNHNKNNGVRDDAANGAVGGERSQETIRPPPGLCLPPEAASPHLPFTNAIPNDSSYNHLSADPPIFVPSGAAQWLGDEVNAHEQGSGAGPNDDLISTLPSFHRSLLRGSFVELYTGAWMPYYVGRLKSFSHKNGYGFLECPSALEHWGFDVFIHKKLLPHPWSLGQIVEFAVSLNDRGQPQAADVRWLPPLQGAQPPRVAAAPKAADEVVEDRAEPAEENTEAEPGEARYLGALKSFSPAQGYGFLTCAELRSRFRRDIYFECSQMPLCGWVTRQTVEFTVVLNARGQPQARKVDWDPVPMRESRSASPAPRDHGTTALDQLSQLLKKLHEGEVMPVLTWAMELQGQDGASIDFVTFVLDRLPRPEFAILHVTDHSVQVLLLLMLSQILREPSRQRLVSWFDVLSRSVDPLADSVSGHFDQMVLEIASHSGRKAMTCLARQDPDGFDVYCASVKRLQAKCRSRTAAGGIALGVS